ncbi:MAG TPA: DEAD/DEAH box helicase [Saprospiraceae bacterium]|nr:DEAD/DEAH box helicase [Saprospiraceae bacterium]HPQ20679.1 DEAD/DEAH box helicase [Saprospiraceae bacterium]HRX29686.1 DEAD/DEAH box helicase [Saprospiraceae bacterium]
MITFKETGLRPELLKLLDEIGFEHPTPIQEKTISQIIESERDLIGIAQTGTGKTAAFSLPVLNNIDPNESDTVQCLILCPTRELCLQIERDIASFSKYLPKITSLAVYGGAAISNQIKALKQKNVQIVVGTPGRTLDLAKRGVLDLSHIKWLVLDEADEMLSMGFKDDLDAILENSPKEKQTLLFSATMPNEIRQIAKKYMHDPEEMSVSKANSGNANITHKYFVVHAKDRYTALKRLADFYPGIYSIVFCRTKAETQDVADKLGHDGYNADALHGDLSQAQRDYVMNRFRKKQIQMLVATDVAARGLDVDNISHVINYNLPDDPEVYVHRSGRTGRAGREGICFSLLHSRELNRLRSLEKMVGKEILRELVPSGKEICAAQLWHLIDKVKQVEINEKQIESFMPEIYERLKGIGYEDLIKSFVSVEFNRFLEYYQDANDINITRSIKEEKGQKSKSDKSSAKSYTKFYINHGKKSKMSPRMLIGLINEHTEGYSIDIGRIDIQQTNSFFDIDSKYEEVLLKAFENSPYEGLKIGVSRGGSKENSEFRGGNSSNRGRRDDGFKSRGRSRRSSDGGSRGGNSRRKRRR